MRRWGTAAGAAAAWAECTNSTTALAIDDQATRQKARRAHAPGLFALPLPSSVQAETQLDRNEDRDRLAQADAGPEAEQLGGLERFLVEAERRIQRAHDTSIRAHPVRRDHALNPHHPLD